MLEDGRSTIELHRRMEELIDRHSLQEREFQQSLLARIDALEQEIREIRDDWNKANAVLAVVKFIVVVVAPLSAAIAWIKAHVNW